MQLSLVMFREPVKWNGNSSTQAMAEDGVSIVFEQGVITLAGTKGTRPVVMVPISNVRQMEPLRAEKASKK